MTRKIPTAPMSIGRQLNFSAGAGNAVCNKLLEPHGLTLAQWAVLQSIWRNGDLSVKEIAKLTGNAPPAASRIVDRMVAAGLLVRQPDQHDRRAVTVNVTDKGEKLRPLMSIYEQVNAVLLAELSEAQIKQLFELLQQVERSGRKWIDDQKE
ncbi:MAG: MarR family winged helix-turn-helix transcriptional regulator [Hyphomicrobiales bacterium]|jgi:DNA-binding MarR family transcriptional regulator